MGRGRSPGRESLYCIRYPALTPSVPVAEGKMCEVPIGTTGDEGDGIAKVERGFVVVVPVTNPVGERRVCTLY